MCTVVSGGADTSTSQGGFASVENVKPLELFFGGQRRCALWSMIADETRDVYDERRYRLRHGLEIDISGSPEAPR